MEKTELKRYRFFVGWGALTLVFGIFLSRGLRSDFIEQHLLEWTENPVITDMLMEVFHIAGFILILFSIVFNVMTIRYYRKYGSPRKYTKQKSII